MLKPDKWIIEMAEKYGMIKPFERRNVKVIDNKKVFSFGTQPYGYDLRLDRKFLVPVKRVGSLLDSKAEKEKVFDELQDDYPIIPPNSYIVGFSIEKLKMPKGITGLIWGKSSLATMGIFVNATPVDAGFEGTLRLCIANFNSMAVKLYTGEGIAQILFFEGDGLPEKDYKEKGGNYGEKTG